MLLNQLRDEQVKREIVSAADVFWEEGRQAGEKQGHRALLERQLVCRFGPLPAQALEALNKADTKDLEAMAERILTATTVAEVLG